MGEAEVKHGPDKRLAASMDLSTDHPERHPGGVLHRRPASGGARVKTLEAAIPYLNRLVGFYVPYLAHQARDAARRLRRLDDDQLREWFADLFELPEPSLRSSADRLGTDGEARAST